jgi:hypothetical protein
MVFIGRNNLRMWTFPIPVLHVRLLSLCAVIQLARFYPVFIITHGTEPFSRSRQFFQHFMELQGSLSCSQEPSTGPYHQSDQSTPPHPISLKSILILSTHLRLGLTSGLFWISHECPICIHLLHSCYMSCPSRLRFGHSNYAWIRVQVMKLLIMQCSPTFCHFISLRYKYSPQHPQSMFLP